MNSRRLRTIVLPAVLGLAGPFLWIAASGWWSLYVTEPLFRWIWITFQLKGAAAYFISAALETILVAAIFGVALRIISSAPWQQPVIAFSLAFVLALLAEAVWAGDINLLVHIVPNVAALPICTAVVQAALPVRQPHDA